MESPSSIDVSTLAESIFCKAKSCCNFADYTGILTLNALARLAIATDEPTSRQRLINEARANYQPFLDGRAEFRMCNFQNYRCGGNGSAYLWWKGELPAANQSHYQPFIEELITQAPRDSRGILCHPKSPEDGKVFIDIAFAVTPFLLYCGLALEREDLIHSAWVETRNFLEALTVPQTGLVNQAINYRGPGHRTQDHWSRGNGWAMHALSALVESMPDNHQDRAEVDERFVSFVDACLRYQDEENGLWHQEMTDPNSFVETSGSGLILQGIGVGIAKGKLSDSHRTAFKRGLQGYLSYIAQDGSVHNTCVGCLSPGMGTKEDYINCRHRINDAHAFGPAILTLAQAQAIGIKHVTV